MNLPAMIKSVEHNQDVVSDVALGVGTFATLLGVTGDLSLASVSGAAVGAGKAVLRAALGQLIAWATSKRAAATKAPAAK